MSGGLPTRASDEAEVRVRQYVEDYLRNSPPAAFVASKLDEVGVGFFPLVDHITVRTLDVDRRAVEFLDLGFELDESLGVLAHGDWWAKVYRKPGLPAVFVDQAFDGDRGATSVIPPWVARFGDQTLHHVAIRVDDVEAAIARLTGAGFVFPDAIIGDKGSDLRQIFTRPEPRNGHPFTVLELIERRGGYAGFSPPAADDLMRSTAIPQ